MADYPDFTYRGDVDIIAQTITRLSVDIAAQTLATLGINITAQDLAELIINIHAQDVGVYLQPEWAAKTEVDKDFVGADTLVDGGSSTLVTYSVPAGKTLYITHCGFFIRATNGADRAANQIGQAWLRDNTTGVIKLYLGGNGGQGLSIAKPIVIPAEHSFVIGVANWSGHSAYIGAAASGYEV